MKRVEVVLDTESEQILESLAKSFDGDSSAAVQQALKQHFASANRDPDQEYFWTAEWQAGEREADKDIQAGRVREFSTVDDLFDDLNS